MFKKILVALDGSSASEWVLQAALELAQKHEGCLNLVSVVYPFANGYPDPIYVSLDGFNTVMTTEAYEGHLENWHAVEASRLTWLRSHMEQAQAQGITAECQEVVGDPGHCLCELARQWQADLIVIGRRGRSGLSELLLGSVSNYVMHHAPCSVLTVQGAAPVPEAEAMSATVSE
jgi:nucleotide-binding universal stress UspA family protein